jgi:hypothetical protein
LTDHDNTTQRIAVSAHEGAHCAAAILLDLKVTSTSRDVKGLHHGETILSDMPPTDTIKETLAYLGRRLMVIRAPYVIGGLEREWSAGDVRDSDILLASIEKHAGRDRDQILARCDAALIKLTRTKEFLALQSAVARELEARKSLTGDEVLEIAGKVYKPKRRLFRRPRPVTPGKADTRVSAAPPLAVDLKADEAVYDAKVAAALSGSTLTDEQQAVIRKAVADREREIRKELRAQKAQDAAVGAVVAAAHELLADVLIQGIRGQEARANKAEQALKAAKPVDLPLPPHRRTVVSPVGEQDQRKAQDRELDKALAFLHSMKGAATPDHANEIVDQFDRETRAMIRLEKAASPPPQRFGPDGEPILGSQPKEER